ncbi:MAG: OB-fold protein, partial [Gemmata sp.]
KAKPTARPTARPVAKAAPAAASDDEGDDRPARKRGRDEHDRDNEDAPRKKGPRGRSRDDEDDDRPARSKRPRDEDDDDQDGPAKKTGWAGKVLLAVLLGMLLLCCGGGGYGGYWFYTKAKKVKDDFVKAVENWNPRVNQFTYNELEVGETTRAEAEAANHLGTGRPATDADLQKAFASDPGRTGDWSAKVSAQRAVVWQSGEDYIIAAFHPTGDGAARLQAKEWRPKSGGALKEGELDDAKFLQELPVGGGPGTPVKAEDLARAYRDNQTDADKKYKKKTLLVEGKLTDIEYSYGTPAELRAVLDTVPKAGGGVIQVRVTVTAGDANKLFGASRGQTVKLKGKCTGYDSIMSVELTGGTFDSAGADPNPTVTATELIGEFNKDSEVTNEKYSGKAITITGAVVERKEGDATLYVTGTGKKGGVNATRIKVEFPAFDDNFKKQVTSARVGSTVKIKGEFRNSFGSTSTITIARPYIVP